MLSQREARAVAVVPDKESGRKPDGRFDGVAGPGRPKGSPNKTTTLLKDAILKAATDAGDGDLAAYLEVQARENPGPFMTLLGKCCRCKSVRMLRAR